jgi:hypothetical protein
VPPCVVIDGKSSSFSFALDALEVVGQLACEDWLPSTRDTKVRPAGRAGSTRRVWACVSAVGDCLRLMPVCGV